MTRVERGRSLLRDYSKAKEVMEALVSGGLRLPFAASNPTA
jgi:hypothetical protein